MRKVDRFLNAAVSMLLVALFALMLSLSAAQIALRFFFGTAIPWADVAARNLVLWVGLLGAVLATGQAKHFQLDVLTRFLSQRIKAWFDVIAEGFGAVICVRFIAIGLDGSGEAFLGIGVAVIAVIIPLSFALMAVLFTVRGVASFRATHGPASTIEQKAGQQ
jgi:TRAP-type C4-dicarboxylate transport system permease small subunit